MILVCFCIVFWLGLVCDDTVVELLSTLVSLLVMEPFRKKGFVIPQIAPTRINESSSSFEREEIEFDSNDDDDDDDDDDVGIDIVMMIVRMTF